MTKNCINSLIIIFLFSFHHYSFSATQTATARGYGANESIALSDAKKIVIGKVCGETIVGSIRLQSETEKSTKISSSGDSSKSLNSTNKTSDDNLSLVGGVVKTFKTISKGEENNIFFVEIDAVVADCQKSSTIQSSLSGQQMFEQLQKINAELKSLSSTDKVVGKPTTLAQKYHNARMLSQRGEVDLALKAYEEVLQEKIIFADPIQDMVTLSKRLYGREGAKKYIMNKLSNLQGTAEYYYALQKLEEAPIPEAWTVINKNVDNFPPLGYSYLMNYLKYCGTLPSREVLKCYKSIGELENVAAISMKLVNKEKDGENMNYYIDSNKASVDSEGFQFQFGKNLYDIKVLTRL